MPLTLSMDLNIYTKPNLLTENFLKFKVLFDPNSFDPDCWSREASDFRGTVKLRIDMTV